MFENNVREKQSWIVKFHRKIIIKNKIVINDRKVGIYEVSGDKKKELKKSKRSKMYFGISKRLLHD